MVDAYSFALLVWIAARYRMACDEDYELQQFGLDAENSGASTRRSSVSSSFDEDTRAGRCNPQWVIERIEPYHGRSSWQVSYIQRFTITKKVCLLEIISHVTAGGRLPVPAMLRHLGLDSLVQRYGVNQINKCKLLPLIHFSQQVLLTLPSSCSCWDHDPRRRPTFREV
jgi:hypothetical protein